MAGKKAGMKQGPLGGILKELGYTEEQVRSVSFLARRLRQLTVCLLMQVFKF